MKKININVYSMCILLGIIVTMFSYCKKQSMDLSSESNNYSLIEEADKIAKQLGFEVSIENIKVRNRKNFHYPDNNSMDLDLERAVTVSFILENGDSITSTTIPIKNADSLFYNIVERDSVRYAMTICSSYDYVSNKVKIKQLLDKNEKINPVICVTWFDCMKNLFASDVGSMIQISGVAGGMGCAVCAAYAGFFTGVGALGCAG